MFFIRFAKNIDERGLAKKDCWKARFLEKIPLCRQNGIAMRVLRKIHENFTEKLQIMLAFSRGVGYII